MERGGEAAVATIEAGLTEEGGFPGGWKLRRQEHHRGSIATETPYGRSVIKTGITFPVMSFREFGPTLPR